MKPLGAAACVLLLFACAACAAGSGGGRGESSALRVVTYTPKSGQPIPSSLIKASPFQLGSSVRSGFACFTMDGVPVAWPAGYSAVKGANGTLEVRDEAGHVLPTGSTQKLNVMTVQSMGDACSDKGLNMTVVLSVQKSG